MRHLASTALLLLACTGCQSAAIGTLLDSRPPPDVATPEVEPSDASGAGLPRLAWTARAEGVSHARAVAVDAEGNVFVAGSFSSRVRFGETTLTAKHPSENVVAKLDRAGRFLWAMPLGGCATEGKPLALAVDREGNAVVAASFTGTLALGATTLAASGAADLVLAKLAPSGRVLWASAIERGDPLNESGLALAVDGEGSITVTGAFTERARLGAIALCPSGFEDAFVARLDRDGAYRWAVAGGGLGVDGGTAISVDPEGRSTLLGVWTGKATFGRFTLALPQELPSTRCLLASLDPAGQFERVVSLDDLGLARCQALAVAADGAVIIAGGNYLASATVSGSFVARIARTGGWLALDQPGAPPITGEGRVANALVVDSRGVTTVAGDLLGGARFGATTLVARGVSDAFVARIDPAGRYLWALALGGAETDLGHALAMDGEGNLLVAGADGQESLLHPASLVVWKLEGGASR
jgi:hypothetical protein